MFCLEPEDRTCMHLLFPQLEAPGMLDACCNLNEPTPVDVTVFCFLTQLFLLESSFFSRNVRKI